MTRSQIVCLQTHLGLPLLRLCALTIPPFAGATPAVQMVPLVLPLQMTFRLASCQRSASTSRRPGTPQQGVAFHWHLLSVLALKADLALGTNAVQMVQCALRRRTILSAAISPSDWIALGYRLLKGRAPLQPLPLLSLCLCEHSAAKFRSILFREDNDRLAPKIRSAAIF